MIDDRYALQARVCAPCPGPRAARWRGEAGPGRCLIHLLIMTRLIHLMVMTRLLIMMILIALLIMLTATSPALFNAHLHAHVLTHMRP